MPSMPQLGDSANLLLGLAPGWQGGSGTALPYTAAPRKALQGIAAPASLPIGAWGGLQLSFHPSVDSLIDTLFDYRLRPVRAISGQLDLRTSNLMLGAGQRAQTIDILADLLGLAPAQLNAGCLILLQMTRLDAELRHALDEGGVGRPIHADHYWTREGRHAIGRLRVARMPIATMDGEHALIGGREAGRYIDYLYDYGSHFISCLRVGDKYFQVLACQPQHYDLLRQQWLPWAGQGDAGPALQGLVNYLGDDWIAATGRVNSAGNQGFEAGAWHAPGLPIGGSLLAPLLRQARGQRDGWPPNQDGVPIGIEFNSHSPYMEQQRAVAWQQIYQGVMLQRFGDGALWRDGVAGPALPSPITPSTCRANHAVAHRDIGELAGIHTCHDGDHGDLFASQIHVHDELSWTAQAGACLLALSINAQASDGRVPRLRLRGGGPEVHISAGTLRGALLIEHTDGRLDALFAGLRFAAGVQGRPMVSAELSRPDRATLLRLRMPLLVLLIDAEARWTRALADRNPALVHAIRGEISWLLRAVQDSGVMHADAPHQVFWNAFHKRAAMLIFCGPEQLVGPTAADAIEWIQAANAALFQLRLDRGADLPASELAAIDRALQALLEQATPETTAPDKTAIAALHACVQKLEQAHNHIVLSSHALLQHQAEPAQDAAAVLLLDQLSQSREGLWYSTLASAGHGDERLMQVSSLLRRAERDYRLGRWLSELANDAATGVVEAPMALLDGTGQAGLGRAQWHELSNEVCIVLEPLMHAHAEDAEALRQGLQAYGAAGGELVDLISSLQPQWQAYLRAHWSHEFAEPASILQRVQLRARRLDSLLAGVIFSRASVLADARPGVQSVTANASG